MLPTGTLNYSSRYFLRVRAVRDHGDELITSVFSFTTTTEDSGGGGTSTSSGSLPSDFNLSTPKDGSHGVNIMPILKWSDTSFEDSYTLEISTNSSFSNLVYSKTDIASGSTSLTVPSGTLTENTTYYWRVKAVNSYGEATASNAPFSFKPFAWARSYGTTELDQTRSVIQTSDGGYLIAGQTDTTGGGSNDIWLIKLNKDLSIGWEKTFDESASSGDIPGQVIETSDSSFVVAGSTGTSGNADFWLVKFDTSGSISLQKKYNRALDEEVNSVKQTSEGGFIMAGRSAVPFGTGPGDFWVVKVDSSGTAEWQKTYDSGGGGDDYAMSVAQLSDGGFVVAGAADHDDDGNYDFWVLRLSSSGTVTWEKRYDLDSGTSEYLQSLKSTSDGGYIAVGYTDISGSSSSEFWVLKLDSSGNVSWQKRFDYPGATDAEGDDVIETSDGGFLLSGYVDLPGVDSRDFWLIKLTSAGAIEWEKRYGDGDSGNDWPNAAYETTDGGFIMAGHTTSVGAGNFDFWVLKINSDGTITFNSGSLNAISTSATVTNTSISPANTTATVTNTSITAQNTSATVSNSSATVNTQAP